MLIDTYLSTLTDVTFFIVCYVDSSDSLIFFLLLMSIFLRICLSDYFHFYRCMYKQKSISENLLFLVRLSLLTMTNPNQLCDVLLFVCCKMADETNLSS